MLPGSFAGNEAHVYLMAMSEDGRWSESLYAGVIRQGEENADEQSPLFEAGGRYETAHEVVLGGVGDAYVDEVARARRPGGPGGGD